MRYLLFIGLCLMLAGCNNSRTGPNGSDTLNGALGGTQQEVSNRFVELLKAEAPAMQISIVSTNLSGGLLREDVSNGIETWISADDAALILDGGVIAGTRGFGAGLMASNVSASRKLILAKSNGTATRLHSFIDGDDRTRTDRYSCQIKNEGRDDIKLQEQPAAAILMSETCQGANIRFKGFFWVHPNRPMILQSTQWIGAALGVMSTRIIP